MLDSEFSETSQNLSSLKQLLFSSTCTPDSEGSDHCTDLRFISFTCPAIVNPPDRKLVNSNCVHWHDHKCLNDALFMKLIKMSLFISKYINIGKGFLPMRNESGDSQVSTKISSTYECT